MNLRRCAFAVVIAAIGLAACDRASEPVRSDASAPAAAAPNPRLVVLGLDAGTWELLGPWMDRGLLPNLARLRASGVHGPLRSTQPSSSPVVWTSIATGKTPEKTGITWFVRFPEGPGKPAPVDRRQRKTSALWNMLSQHRTDVAVLGWYVTWPAEQVDGRLLSDIAHFGNAPSTRWPDTFLWDLEPVPQADAIAAMPRFMDYPYDAARAVRKEGETPSLDYLVYDRFVRAWTRDRFYLNAAERTLADGPLPQALFLYLRGTDDVQHGFWKFMDPAAFTPRLGADGKPVPGTTVVAPEQVAAFGKVIERYWQWTDEAVGKVLARYAGDPPLVIVCSDHGAGPAVGQGDEIDVPEYLHLSGSHRIDGMFLASGPGIRSAANGGGKGEAPGKGIEITGASIYDIAPTILHALGLPVGKDFDGRVLTEIFEKNVAGRPVAMVDTWDRPAAAAAHDAQLPPEVDEQMLEHLRSLGYIGQ